MFINTGDGKLILLEEERSTHRPSPYMNKFGETYSEESKKWDNFYMDEIAGGKSIYEDFRKMYMNFSIANEIVKDRSLKEYVWRLAAI